MLFSLVVLLPGNIFEWYARFEMHVFVLSCRFISMFLLNTDLKAKPPCPPPPQSHFDAIFSPMTTSCRNIDVTAFYYF